jgi:uncharacterized protein (TIGR02284 family)
MATRIGTESDPVKMLEHLMTLDYDAIDAYQAAIERLDNDEYASVLVQFKGDHERHVTELGPIVTQLGGEPPSGPGAKSFLTAGKVKLANLMGDEAILRAMKTNESDTNTAYEKALAKAPIEAREVLQRGREDERRHLEWLVSTIEGKAARKDRAKHGRGGEPRPPNL